MAKFISDLRCTTLTMIYGATEGDNPFELEVVNSPGGLRVPDDALLSAVDAWHQNYLSPDEGILKRLGHSFFADSIGLSTLLYISRDPSFDRDVTDKRKTGKLSDRFMKGTRLSIMGLIEAERMIQP